MNDGWETQALNTPEEILPLYILRDVQLKNKGLDFRDDCTEFMFFFRIFMILCNCKLIRFFAKSLNKPFDPYI